MKIERVVLMTAILAAANPAWSASNPNIPGVPTQMVITVRPVPGVTPTPAVATNDLAVTQGKVAVPVTRSRAHDGRPGKHAALYSSG